MGYGIIRVQKVKAAAVGSMQYHNDRVPGEHSNEDIDQSRTELNREYVRHGSYRAEVNDRIERFRESTRKVRKDAVVLAEGVATASPEFFEGKTRDEVMDYFDDVFEFCKDEFGEQNLVHFTVHMDETTPHAHFGFTPLKNGTLSWKNYFDGRDALRDFQTRYWERVGKPWGLERGEVGSGKKHKTTQEMKRDAQRELREVQGQVDAKRTELDATNREVAESAERLECLRQDEIRLREEIEELEPAAQTLSEGVRTLWKARSDGSREEVLGSDLEGLRSQISDLSSQIADVDGRADRIERSLPELRARCASLGERFEMARTAVVKALEGLREVPDIVSAWAQELARKMGKPLFNPNSLDYQMRQVSRAADAYNRDRPHVTQQRGRGAR